MTDPDVILENRAEKLADRKAFARLTPGQKRLARIFAAMGFTGRQGVVGVAGAVIGVAEIITNYLLVWPYMKLWQGAVFLFNSAAMIAKAPIGLAVGTARLSLALVYAGLGGVARFVNYLSGRNLIQDATHSRWINGITASRDKLNTYAMRVAHWGVRVKDNIDAAWDRGKTHLKNAARRTLEAFEYYGALGLYRGTRWILNPRIKGKPLLGHETLNKSAGLVLAGAAFIGFTGVIGVVGVWAKLAHVQIVASFFTDAAPLGMKIAKQVLLHATITGGLTASKFTLLPIIAAARQALKSTEFTRGVAHAYNVRLHRKHAQTAAPRPQAETAPRIYAAPTTTNERPQGKIAAEFNKISLGFVGTFVQHLVEKSSPNYYESREKYYARRHACPRANV